MNVIRMRVLLIEDDKMLSAFIKRYFTQQNMVVDLADNGREGMNLAFINKGEYDVIVLDILLPEIDGLKICSRLRELGDLTPILILSGRDQVDQKVEGLNVGADDYLTKPFEIEELYARVRALHRRKVGKIKKIIQLKGITLDADAHEVRIKKKVVPLTHIEFRLLKLLMENSGKVISRSDIVSKVWNMLSGDEIFSNSINVHIKNLRKKIGDNGREQKIQTVRGTGYKFVED